MKVLNFGSCNLDFVYNVDHIVDLGETMAAGRFSQFPGGKGLNQAIAIAKAGVPVYFAGCIGEDGRILFSMMEQVGVDLTYLKEVPKKTGHAIIQVNAVGENAIIIYRGANAAVTRNFIDEVLENFEEGDIILLQNEISNLQYLINRAAMRKMKIILNPSPFEEKLREIGLSDIFCMILNETEAMQWIERKNPYDFLSWASEKFPTLKVVLTCGGKGSLYLEEGKIYRQHAFKTTAVDTTGAGDTFTGYFVAGLYQGKQVPEVIRIASMAAAIAVSRKGAASSIPEYKEVEAKLTE